MHFNGWTLHTFACWLPATIIKIQLRVSLVKKPSPPWAFSFLHQASTSMGEMKTFPDNTFCPRHSIRRK